MLITDTKIIKKYYKALLDREQSFVGIFFVGVKTTSVFCIATCRARKPKFENVTFYTTYKEALDNGYRPCKICKPTQNANEAPAQVASAIQLVKDNPKEKITDSQLRKLAIRPEVVRRWFNKHYGMTFQAYQRMCRINTAYQELKTGKKTTHTAFDMGYESLSGFGYTFKKIIGESPQKSATKNIIVITRMTTPLGPMFICATGNGVCLLEFADRHTLENSFKSLQKMVKATIIIGENKHSKQAIGEVTEYFEGKRIVFDVPLDTPGTDFQNLAWNSLKEVGYGTTTTYQKQAAKIKRPKAVRAVASANGSNRVAIIIPCHRVIGKDGKMTGYSGGVERKKWLIAHEQNTLDLL